MPVNKIRVRDTIRRIVRRRNRLAIIRMGQVETELRHEFDVEAVHAEEMADRKAHERTEGLRRRMAA